MRKIEIPFKGRESYERRAVPKIIVKVQITKYCQFSKFRYPVLKLQMYLFPLYFLQLSHMLYSYTCSILSV